MRLVVKAGSIDEADDQRGLAHMLEHMNFNGSTHFKPGELVGYLESIGARFGADVNAYTGYDETVYMLDVPTDHEGAVGRGLDALSDFAGGATLAPAEIDRERGVVIEEWRGRQGAATRMLQPQVDALFGDSKYARRQPIGTPDIIRTFTPQRLREFYRENYRPDRMAVIVVGAIDPARMEAMIRERFGTMPRRPAAPRPVYPIPSHADTRYVSVSDPEAQGSSVSIVHEHPLEPSGTVGDYRRDLVEALVHQMFNQRLAEISREPDAPFLAASTGEETLGRTVEAFTIGARVQDGQDARGLTALAREAARIRQHGFAESEIDRARRIMLAGYERAFNERTTSESTGYAEELVRHFLTNEPAPGIAVETALVRRFLPTITPADAETAAARLLAVANRVVIATSPSKAGSVPITQAAMRAAVEAGSSGIVEPYHDTTITRHLIGTEPTPGTVTARREIPAIGVTVLTLSNGVNVWLKPTDFKNDQVVFTAYARGGTSLAAPEDYMNAALATSLVAMSGVGGFTPIDLGKLLAGRIAGASAYIDDYTEGISGSATPKDLRTALQLAYLTFTAPNVDPRGFDLLKQRLAASLANREQNPAAVFGDRVRSVNTLDHYSTRPLTSDDLSRLDPARMLAYYRARFANAADFTFFFAGAFTIDDITPLLTTYLGSLPSGGVASAAWRNMHVTFPATPVRETVRKGREPRSQTVVTFFSDTGLEELAVHRLNAAVDVLQNRLREVLREQLGGTYSVAAGYSDTSPQPGYGTTMIQFGSAPDRAQGLTDAVMREVERLRREGPTAADIDAVKQAEKQSLQIALRQNGYWVNSLQALHVLGRDPLGITQRLARVDALTVENVHDAFRRYVSADRYTILTLMPEAGAP